VNRDILSALFWTAFGAYFSVESYRFGLGEWSRPGPGYFPFGAGVLFSAISLSELVKSFRKRASGVEAGRSSEQFRLQNIVLIIAGMLAYALLLKSLGFVVCTFGLTILFFRMIARKGWLGSMTTALAVALIFEVFFNMLLNAQLPNGVLGFLW
jgi:putative tricarboxylic transport membrane protein